MARPGDPPPEGVPQGGDDEYRSTVFDESFVRAARLQEFSARERLEDHEHAVRALPAESPHGSPWQGLILVVLIALAFGTAIYLGVRAPQQPAEPPRQQPLRTMVVPLAPTGEVPGGKPAELFERSPAAQFYVGAAGVNLPPARSTGNFSESQVLAALTTAKEYVTASSLDPAVVTGNTVRPVRVLLDPLQHRQFDRSLERPAADGRHAATGWLVRFGPGTALTGDGVRVRGTLEIQEAGSDALEVHADHVFVYAVRPAGTGTAAGIGGGSGRNAGQDGRGGADAASLFTVHREVRLHFDREDLRQRQLKVHQVSVEAGPMSCAGRPYDVLRPVTAGQFVGEDDRPVGTDPYARTGDAGGVSLCGTLAPSSQPRP